MQDSPKAVRSIPYVSVAFFPSLKQNFIAYRSFMSPHCIFEIRQQWQSEFSRVYSNCCCSCSFEPEIIKIGQSSHKMYSNNIINIQKSTAVLNAWTKKSGNLLNSPRIYRTFYAFFVVYIYIYIVQIGIVINHKILFLIIFMLRCSSLLFLFVCQDPHGGESGPYLPKRFQQCLWASSGELFNLVFCLNNDLLPNYVIYIFIFILDTGVSSSLIEYPI